MSFYSLANGTFILDIIDPNSLAFAAFIALKRGVA